MLPLEATAMNIDYIESTGKSKPSVQGTSEYSEKALGIYRML